MADDEIEINLRPARQVAARVVVLSTVAQRAFLETAANDPDAAAERFDIVAWLKTEGLADAVSASERRLLETPLSALDAEDANSAGWSAEALVALGWALGLTPAMPPADTPADPSAILAAVPTPWDKTASFLDAAQLRPEPEIATERERAELWHWRAELADAYAAASPGQRRDLTAAAREVARDAAAAGLIPTPVGGDFPVRGTSYRAIPDEEQDVLASIAAERVHALNWLCGFGSDWDHVPTEV